MNKNYVLGLCCVAWLALSGCSRQQSDWQKTRETNTADAYEQFLKKYPTGEFTAQAQARVKELYEERDWQKARDADTPEAYQAFLKQYPEGKWTEEARIRVENFTLAQAPSGTSAVPGADSASPPGSNDSSAPPARAPASGTAADAGGLAASGAGTKSGAASRSSTVAGSGTGSASGAQATSGAVKPAVKAAAGGSYAIQLGAFKSGAAAAHARWSHLQREYPSVLAGLSSKVVAKKTAAGSLYRLQATGLSEKHARAICGSLKARSQACLVVPPTPG